MESTTIRPKPVISMESCIACGACDEACPTDVIRLDQKNFPSVAYPEDCQACFLCEFACPTDAIKVYTYKWFQEKS